MTLVLERDEHTHTTLAIAAGEQRSYLVLDVPPESVTVETRPGIDVGDE